MKDIPYEELERRVIAIQGKLTHLKALPEHARRKSRYEIDLQSVGNPFIRDVNAIMASKAWRRADGKNQVASTRQLPHARNRLTHITEVIHTSLRLSDWLGLDLNLTHATASVHDLGHVPFGHQGEHYLQKRYKQEFCHEVMGVVVMQHIERNGKGLNLTHQTLLGGRWHSGKHVPPGLTQEALVVRYADKIAYLYSDYSDFGRFGHDPSKELVEAMGWFGKDQRSRTFRTMMALCEESVAAGKVVFEYSEPAIKFNELRTLMYKEYVRIVQQDVSRILDPIWEFLEQGDLVPPWLGIALLTDDEVCRLVEHKGILSSHHLKGTGLSEILKRVEKSKLFAIDGTALDLDW